MGYRVLTLPPLGSTGLIIFAQISRAREDDAEMPGWQKFFWRILCPCVLLYYSCSIYVGQCVGIYWNRFVHTCLFCACRFCGCYTFTDKNFTPNAKSLGAVGGYRCLFDLCGGE